MSFCDILCCSLLSPVIYFCKLFKIEDTFVWNTHKDVKISKYWILKSRIHTFMHSIHLNGSYTFQWIELYKSEFKIQDGTQVNNPLKKSS